MDPELEVTNLPSLRPSNPEFNADYGPYRGTGVPIVIDNGATTIRYGFATSQTPQSGPNIIAKYRDRRSNRPILLFGEAVDAETGAKSQSKTPWEGDVLLNFDALEASLDHSLIRLGCDTETVEHPIIMTERICTPIHSRSSSSELLFELYHVPRLSYCLDSIMSLYYNSHPSDPSAFTGDACVISFNTASTSIIPVLSGKGILSKVKRVPWGVTQCSDYLAKLLQLKYPNFPGKFTSQNANWMYRTFCCFAENYREQLHLLQDPLGMKAAARIVQFPYTVTLEAEKNEEELARIAERRREQGKRLQEMSAKFRQEKLVQKETDYSYLTDLREQRSSFGRREWLAKLQLEGFENDGDLDEVIKGLETALRRVRKKDPEAEENGEEPSFPLLDLPDDELDEEQLKEKKRQRLMKAGYDARVRARAEKLKEQEERAAEMKREEDERIRDPAKWTQNLRQAHQELSLKLRERKKRKAALTDRKSAASQARMKNITSLASDERVGRKKRKTANEDSFGANDEDWAVYRKINLAAPSSDEEEDLAQLTTLEQKLLQHDPNFTLADTHAAITNRRSELISAFRPEYEDGNLEGQNRIHLNVERWRVPETYFNPSMAGVDSAGLGELLEEILMGFSESEKARLAGNVFLTGSPSAMPGLPERLYSTVRPILAPEIEVKVSVAQNPSVDAWHGMAQFANTKAFDSVCITYDEYQEWGPERVKRWWGGNWNMAF